ncbi:hypothetical protein [Vibrio sp. F74]|uniref:hypothetical protein n=1 Tax=Vibrio sp. F74 TaxID=700020 RepID=UPI0035F5F853
MGKLCKLLIFVALSNLFFVGAIFLIEYQTGILAVKFISDYFFYSMMAQWLIGTFFMVSPPTNTRYIKHSPNLATSTAASMNDGSGEQAFTYVDLPLSQKLFLSGSASLLFCLVL